MGVPAALAHGVVASTGCIGNRVYTDLADDELYVVVPGATLARMVDEIDGIAAANSKLASYQPRSAAHAGDGMTPGRRHVAPGRVEASRAGGSAMARSRGAPPRGWVGGAHETGLGAGRGEKTG
jgi:hypothetical protein